MLKFINKVKHQLSRKRRVAITKQIIEYLKTITTVEIDKISKYYQLQN